ncbi:hypothetical protein NDU88_001951 [Pleurodeles waltl]|uniref:Uncharacterized protein n=1 Tax=Pleurodeles waltl TaxID=8319 RepID=A0AAV7VZ64_PLEWA|nr:hypothetical protein NDU88_001951 [Pleurodeles waltl]
MGSGAGDTRRVPPCGRRLRGACVVGDIARFPAASVEQLVPGLGFPQRGGSVGAWAMGLAGARRKVHLACRRLNVAREGPRLLPAYRGVSKKVCGV